MSQLLTVALGGALGSVGRYLFVIHAGRLFGMDFPWGTLGVNVLGSFLMGLLIGAGTLVLEMSQEVRLFLAVGFLGGFTTFSSFSLDAMSLFQRGAWVAGSAYVGGSVLAGLAAFGIGMAVWRLWV